MTPRVRSLTTRIPTAIALAALACGCSRDERGPNPKDITIGPRAVPSPLPGAAATPPYDAASYTMAEVFDASARAGSTSPPDTNAPSEPASPPTRINPPTPLGAAAGSTAPKANPDDAVLERTRVASGRCFSSLPAGPGFGPPTRSAHVSLVVVPTGSVSRADVTSDDTDNANVIDCIQHTAQSAMFSDNGGGPLRTYTIDVRVSAPAANGGR